MVDKSHSHQDHNYDNNNKDMVLKIILTTTKTIMAQRNDILEPLWQPFFFPTDERLINWQPIRIHSTL